MTGAKIFGWDRVAWDQRWIVGELRWENALEVSVRSSLADLKATLGRLRAIGDTDPGLIDARLRTEAHAERRVRQWQGR